MKTSPGKTVIILGLYNVGGLKYVKKEELLALASGNRAKREIASGCYPQVWSLNDWYKFYPNLRSSSAVAEHSGTLSNPPDWVFNIHRAPYTHPCKDRFPGDWKKEYNDSGARIVGIEPIPGIKNMKVLDTDRLLEEFPSGMFSSTLGTMIATSISEGYGKIILRGFHMIRSGEYEYQLPGVILAVEEARKRGIEVDAPFFDKWVEAVNKQKVDWTKIISLKPYWIWGKAPSSIKDLLKTFPTPENLPTLDELNKQSEK